MALWRRMARERLRGRDKDDGSYLALALVFDYPLWTADRDV
jgi:predicted nucleic acid-binding protein